MVLILQLLVVDEQLMNYPKYKFMLMFGKSV